MRADTTEARPSVLALYWLGIQAVWGALLAISLQARSIELAGTRAFEAYGVLAAGGALVAACVQIAAGILSDRRRGAMRSRVQFYGLGAIVGSAGVAWFYVAPSFAQLVAAYVVVEVGVNVAMAAYQPVIADVVVPSRVGAASSWMAALQSVGNAAGALCASFIGDARAVAAAIVALLLGTCAWTSAHVRGLAVRTNASGPRAFRSGAFVTLFVSRGLVYVGFFTLLGYLLFYVRGSLGDVPVAEIRRVTGVLVLLFTLMGALGAGLAARPSDRADKRVVATVGCGVFILALVAFIASHALAGMYVATAVAGVAWGAFLVADWALACRILPPASMATLMALWNLAVVVPQIVAPALATAFVTRLGIASAGPAARFAFALAAIETALGILYLWRLPSALARE